MNFGISEGNSTIMNKFDSLFKSEMSYKQIIMENPDDIDIDEYVSVEIKIDKYVGTRLYLGFCFLDCPPNKRHKSN